ncbi:NADP oxidoreductase [Geodermatophilus sp. TF02-6]|uniref:NADPH-dependent F420 reductase n=1 Tax=Geodermatophilus sp. TF02-6 TaxID=2250575 RepID=UPI000DE9BB32|nr:NAD(P)-binding domain-containing protein [Geodermatophilus sp. TF02-6]RBY83827.1 NADP oxidoreductase [Geodermatophilus sp. TF02-6]
MSDITIVGTGNVGAGIAARGVAAGHSLPLLDRDVDTARQLAGTLDVDADPGTVGDEPTGDIVVLAVPFEAAEEIVADYGAALSGKTVVDITNPVDFDTFDSLVVAPGTSAAETIAGLADDGVHVVKAFNTTFAAPVRTGEVAGQPLDVFIAGESDQAKEKVSGFASAAGLRPIDVGPLRRTRHLEGFQFVVMTLQADPASPAFNWDTALKILTP